MPVDMDMRKVCFKSKPSLFGYPRSKAVGRSCREVIQGCDLYGNVYCDPHCPLIGMAVHGQAIHRCDLLYRNFEGDTVRAVVNSLIVPGHSPAEMAIVHLLNPFPTDATGGSPAPDVPVRETARQIGRAHV